MNTRQYLLQPGKANLKLKGHIVVLILQDPYKRPMDTKR